MHEDVEHIIKVIGSLEARIDALQDTLDGLAQRDYESEMQSALISALQEFRAEFRRTIFQWIGERAVASVALVVGTAVLTWALLTGKITK